MGAAPNFTALCRAVADSLDEAGDRLFTFTRSMAFEVRIDFHWLGGKRLREAPA